MGKKTRNKKPVVGLKQPEARKDQRRFKIYCKDHKTPVYGGNGVYIEQAEYLQKHLQAETYLVHVSGKVEDES